MANILYDAVYDIFTRFKHDRVELEDKWNRNRAAFSKDTDEFDAYAGAWRTYQQRKGVQIASEEQFNEAGANDPAQSPDWHSDTFMSTTKQKVVAGANLVNDQVFKTGGLPFSLEIYASKFSDESVYKVLDRKRTNLEDEITEDVDSTDTVKEMKKVVQSAALYGEGYFKKEVETITYLAHRLNNKTGEVETVSERKEVLSGTAISIWDIFRDLTQPNLDDGDGVIQRAFISVADIDDFIEAGQEDHWDVCMLDAIRRRKMTEMNTDHTALPTPISDSTTSISPHIRAIDYLQNNLEYLEAWVRVPTYVVETFLCVPEPERTQVGYSYVLVGLLDEEVVRFALVEKGVHPFLKVDWEKDPDSLPGIGIADNVDVEQKVLNGMIRSFEDNKKLSSNLLLAVDKTSVSGDWNSWEPGKDLGFDGVRDINQAIQQFVVNDVGQTLVGSIDMFLQFADLSSNIPRAQQGMPTGNSTTAFEIQQRLERSGKYIGTVISNIDEDLLRPFVSDTYDLKCLDENFDDMGGVFRVTPEGFYSYEARAIKQQSLMMIFSMIGNNPEFMQVVNSQYFLREIAKAQGLDPDEFVKSDEQIQKEQQQREASPEAQMAHRMQALQVEMLSKQVDELQSKIALNEASAAQKQADAMATQYKAVSDSAPPLNIEEEMRLD